MFTNKRAIGTLSLGQHSSHTLDKKIRVAAQYGFEAVELVYSDLEAYAESLGIPVLQAAEKVAALCHENTIEVLSLAPFENFEGARSPLSSRLEKARRWIGIARTLKAPYLQVPSQFCKDASTDECVIVSELRQLADLGSSKKPQVSIAYENLSWGTYCSTWQTVLYLINTVDRPNFGICLDSFHEVTKLWEFIQTSPLEKIFYVQLSDGEKFDPPFSTQHVWYLDGEAPEFTWSKHARPFPLKVELGGYMPVVDVVRAWVLDKKFTGWVSLEVFDWHMRDEGFQVETAGIRARDSWRRLQEALTVGKEYNL